jgi:hypothetical protein
MVCSYPGVTAYITDVGESGASDGFCAGHGFDHICAGHQAWKRGGPSNAVQKKSKVWRNLAGRLVILKHGKRQVPRWRKQIGTFEVARSSARGRIRGRPLDADSLEALRGRDRSRNS